MRLASAFSFMASVALTYDLDIMSEQLPRSPYDIVGGLVYFPRMLDFIEFDEGRTPPDFRRWEPPRLAPILFT